MHPAREGADAVDLVREDLVPVGRRRITRDLRRRPRAGERGAAGGVRDRPRPLQRVVTPLGEKAGAAVSMVTVAQRDRRRMATTGGSCFETPVNI